MPKFWKTMLRPVRQPEFSLASVGHCFANWGVGVFKRAQGRAGQN